MSALLPVFGISRLRMETDGDGVTTLVGCLGCPLRCRLCINPHAQNPATPHRRLSAEQLVEELRVDGLYFSATGGGATFGGGEPLLHADFLAEFAEKRPADWRVRVETSLNADEAQLRRALDAVDGWIVDVKDLNPEIYRCYTGADNARVLRNLHILAENCPERVRIRLPRIPGFNTDGDRDASERALREMSFSEIQRFDYVDPARR